MGRTGERLCSRRGIRAALLSLVLPGAGQVWAGRFHRGIILIILSVTTLVLSVAVLVRDLADLAALLVRPGVLDVVLVANVVILAYRGFAVVDAYGWGRRPARRSSRSGSQAEAETGWAMVRIMATVIALALVLPHVAIAYYGLEARATLGGVFQGTPAQAAELDPSGSSAPWDEDDRLTVLLIGSDAGPRRSGVRTDTIMVASVEASTGQAALISIPRNLVRVPLPIWVPSDRSCRCFPDPINGLYAHFRDRTDLVPDGVDPGAAVLRGALEQLLGVRIDHHAIADLGGFVQAVDALGGVAVEVEQRIFDQLDSPEAGEWDAIDLQPGRHHLDGRQALVYVRTRRGGSDYLRMARQRCFLGAVLERTDTADVLRAFPRLSAIVRSSISTDLPRATLTDVVDLATTVDRSAIDVLSVTPPDLAHRDPRGYPVADPPPVRDAVRELLSNDDQVEVAGSDPETEPNAAAPTAVRTGTTGGRAPGPIGTTPTRVDTLRTDTAPTGSPAPPRQALSRSCPG